MACVCKEKEVSVFARVNRYDPTFKRELFDLEKDNIRNKVDHPPDPGGSKDVSDAVVGAVWNAITGKKRRARSI